jgi:hypothetical protein
VSSNSALKNFEFQNFEYLMGVRAHCKVKPRARPMCLAANGEWRVERPLPENAFILVE